MSVCGSRVEQVWPITARGAVLTGAAASSHPSHAHGGRDGRGRGRVHIHGRPWAWQTVPEIS